jgi:hypothetical protein
MTTTGGLQEKRVLVVCKAVADDAQTRTRHSHTIQYVAMQSALAPDKRKVTFEFGLESGRTRKSDRHKQRSKKVDLRFSRNVPKVF